MTRYRTEDVISDASSFEDILLPEPVVRALSAAGFSRPSPVQRAAIPLGRVGSDLIVQAKSGTGKTVVFAVICLERVRVDLPAPQALVLAPTREVALQSADVIQRIANGLPQPAPSCAAFVGGLPTANDEKRLRRVCHIAIGTPGRVLALLQAGSIAPTKLKMLVLDEADQLLGDNFYVDVASIHDQLPKKKQVMAFSATYTADLLADLEPLMTHPQKLLLCDEQAGGPSLVGVRQFYRLVGGEEEEGKGVDSAAAGMTSTEDLASPAASVAAEAPDGQLAAADAASGETMAPAPELGASRSRPVALTGGGAPSSERPGVTGASAPGAGKQGEGGAAALLSAKVSALLDALSSLSFHQAVVFCNRKPVAEWLARRIAAAGFPAAHLNAELPQAQRMAAMEDVRAFRLRVVVTTDLMARGVDLERINLVMNLDIPPDAATYLHRVGRTGRFGTRGVAIALVSGAELRRLRGFLTDMAGGEVDPLPEVIPPDLYTFQLGSDWEQRAFEQLLAAPTASPPSSPPPLARRRPQRP